MLFRGDKLLFCAGLFYVAKYVGHTLANSLDFFWVMPNYFMWAFLVLAVIDYAYRLWLLIKEHKGRRNTKE